MGNMKDMKLKTAIEEVWKDIPQHKDLYQASNFGRIKSLERTITRSNGRKQFVRGGILSQHKDRRGYMRVKIANHGVHTQAQVHQLVAMAFLGHEPNGNIFVVDHVNTIKTDNRIDNLQVISNRENCTKDRDGHTSNFIGVSWSKSSKKWQAKIFFDGEHHYLGTYDNEEDAANAYNIKLSELSGKVDLVEKVAEKYKY